MHVGGYSSVKPKWVVFFLLHTLLTFLTEWRRATASAANVYRPDKIDSTFPKELRSVVMQKSSQSDIAVAFITWEQGKLAAPRAAILSFLEKNPGSKVLHIGDEPLFRPSSRYHFELLGGWIADLSEYAESAFSSQPQVLASPEHRDSTFYQRALRAYALKKLSRAGFENVWYSDTDVVFTGSLPAIESSDGLVVGRHYGGQCNGGIYGINRRRVDIVERLLRFTLGALSVLSSKTHWADEIALNHLIDRDRIGHTALDAERFGAVSLALGGWEGEIPDTLMGSSTSMLALHYVNTRDENGRRIDQFSIEEVKRYDGRKDVISVMRELCSREAKILNSSGGRLNRFGRSSF